MTKAGRSKLLINVLAVFFATAVFAFSSAQVAAETTTVSSSALQVADSNSQAIRPGTSAEMMFMLEQLQQEMRELRGQVEQLQHELQQTKKQQRDRYIDLDRRIMQVNKAPGRSAPIQSVPTQSATTPAVTPPSTEGASSSVGLTPGVTAPTSRNAGESTVSNATADGNQRQAYLSAYSLIKTRQYDEAVDALHDFINKYPDTELAGNAYYWLGEVYLVLPKLEQAKQSFVVVVGKFPRHRKASDAFFKLGVTYDRLGNKDSAKQYLNETVKRFPDSAAASLAKDYLKQL